LLLQSARSIREGSRARPTDPLEASAIAKACYPSGEKSHDKHNVTHSIPEHGEMKRSVGGLSVWSIGPNTHLMMVTQQANSTNSRFNIFIHRAADNAREICFSRTLKLILPGKNILSHSDLLTARNSISTNNVSICRDDASQTGLEISHCSK